MSAAIEAAVETAILTALQEMGHSTPRQVGDHPAVAQACDGCPLRVRDFLDRMRRAGKIAHDHSRYPPIYWCWPAID